jgi:hypothetical protein
LIVVLDGVGESLDVGGGMGMSDGGSDEDFADGSAKRTELLSMVDCGPIIPRCERRRDDLLRESGGNDLVAHVGYVDVVVYKSEILIEHGGG